MSCPKNHRTEFAGGKCYECFLGWIELFGVELMPWQKSCLKELIEAPDQRTYINYF